MVQTAMNGIDKIATYTMLSCLVWVTTNKKIKLNM